MNKTCKTKNYENLITKWSKSCLCTACLTLRQNKGHIKPKLIKRNNLNEGKSYAEYLKADKILKGCAKIVK